MPDQTYQDAVKKISFTNIDFSDLPEEVGNQINRLIIDFPGNEVQIIQLLPNSIRLIYLIGELESIIGNDGLLAVFINYDKNQVDIFEAAIEQTGHKKYLSLFKKARLLAESKYVLKNGINLIDDLPEADIEELFGMKIINQIESIEEKFNELQSDGEYWEKVEVFYRKSIVE